MINKNYNRTLVIRRLKPVTGHITRFTSTGTYEAHVQRLTEERTSSVYGVYGATHKGWTDITNDIKVKDQVTDEYGIVYDVVDVIDEGKDFAINSHKEVILKVNTNNP